MLRPFSTLMRLTGISALTASRISSSGLNIMILDNRRRKRCGIMSSATSAFTFSPSPGIIQPLYLTALKYRHPSWRRRALEVEESGLARDVESTVGAGQAGAWNEH